MENRDARYLNILLGIWLFISAFTWSHSSAQLTNTWIMGAITVIAAWVATRVPPVRFVNTAVGIWLIISSFALPRLSVATTWNNLLVGVAITVVSLVGTTSSAMSGRRRRVTSAV